MAKIPKLPQEGVIRRLRGHVMFANDRGIIVAKRWPKKRPGPKTPAQQEAMRLFTLMAEATKQIPAYDQQAARELAIGSGYTWRDVISRAMVGRLITFEWIGITPEIIVNIQDMLDMLYSAGPCVIERTINGWIGVPLVNPEYIIRIKTDLSGVEFVPIGSITITGLDGDVIAGPGTGVLNATLSETGVVAGTYEHPVLDVDAKGRITSIVSDPIDPGITELTGDVEAGPGSGSQATTLSATGVTPGTYALATVEVDAKGRVLSAEEGTIPDPEAPTEIVPGWRTTRYYTTPGLFAGGSSSANRLYAIPIRIPLAETITQMAIWVTSFTVGSDVTLGLYENANGVPGALIAVAGHVATTANGRRQLTGLSIPVTGPFIWAAVALSHTIQVRQNTNGATNMADITGTLNDIGTNFVIQGCEVVRTYTQSVLPNPFPTFTESVTSMPCIYIGK